MTSYKNFLVDFPDRCFALWSAFERQARQNDKEVTLMLAIASSGFVIPYERLRRISDEKLQFSVERAKFVNLATIFKEQMNTLFFDATTGLGREQDWKYDDCVPKKVWTPQEIIDWIGNSSRPSQEALKTRKNIEVLTLLRNALAHGNIYTNGDGKVISEITFLSYGKLKNSSRFKYKIITVSPQSFGRFLERWFLFLSDTQSSELFGLPVPITKPSK